MTNENIEITKEEEVKENRFTKHLKKHKVVYVAVASSGVTVLGMTLSNRMENYNQYMKGASKMHDALWGYFADNVKNGVLSMELLTDTDDESLKGNMKILKSFVESKED